MPPRIYIDTSVPGGVHVAAFLADSRWVFDEAAGGSLILLISDILVRELASAPESVRQEVEGLPTSAVEGVGLDDRMKELRDAYLAAKVVGLSSELDATHVAIATVAGADALLSWDRRHIVGLVRVQAYNKVNRKLGYQELTIVTPTRYRANQTRTP
jgi:hypothetical protein